VTSGLPRIDHTPPNFNLQTASLTVPFNWVGTLSPATFRFKLKNSGIGKVTLRRRFMQHSG
ncbi:hypothetical protein, partial [Massilia genomosp. 1]